MYQKKIQILNFTKKLKKLNIENGNFYGKKGGMDT